MNKRDIAKELAEEIKLSRPTDFRLMNTEAQRIVNNIFDKISKVTETEPVTITGFGTFRRTIRQPRVARNPQTGESVTVGKKRVLTFKPSDNQKEEFD